MESRTIPPGVFRFGPFEADFHSFELRKYGIKVHIQEQPLRVLGLLIGCRGRVVTRQELRESLWPHSDFPDFDDSLNSAVKKLRDALADDAGKPLYIETVPRHGYRFIAPIEGTAREAEPSSQGAAATLRELSAAGAAQANDAAQSALKGRRLKRYLAVVLAMACLIALGAATDWMYMRQRITKAAATPVIRSLAVLPFDNLSGDAGQDYFADGITDALINDLAQLGSIRVTSRTSTMQYRGVRKPIGKIGQELSVEVVVEGSVARSGNKVRVNAELIDTSNDQPLWAQSFERSARDIVALQDDIARSVAERIQTVLKPDQRARLENAQPVVVDAYEAFLQGLFYLNHRRSGDLSRSLEYFKQATMLDSSLAPAYAGMAQAYNLLGDYDEMTGREAGPKAEAAARKALKLNDSLGVAHGVLAFTLWKYDWDWKGAESEFQRALALNPNDANTHHVYGLFLACKGDFPTSKDHLKKARELDPLSLIIRTNIGWVSYYERDFARAIAEYEEVLKIYPAFVPARQKLWIAYALEGNKEQAIRELGNVLRAFGHEELAQEIEKEYSPTRFSAVVQRYIDSGFLTAYEKGRLQSLLVEKEEALRSLREAEADRSGWMIYIGVEPVFDSLRSSPEFQKLSADVNIPYQAAAQ
jgi:TolB-like protein/DNA-binding winged helix-turn-helix (wHTH) protein